MQISMRGCFWLFEYLADGNLRKKADVFFPEHRAVCRAYKDKLGLVEYSHKLDGSYYCEYDITDFVPITKYFELDKKASAKDIVILMHGVLMTLIVGKKIGLFENSFVLHPQYVFVNRSSAKPKLVYLPMDVSLVQADEYFSLLDFLEETCDYSDTLAGGIVFALKRIGYDINEAASIIVEAANKNRVDEKYKETPEKIETDYKHVISDSQPPKPQTNKKSGLLSKLFGGTKQAASEANDQADDLVDQTCLYEEEESKAYLYLLEGDKRHEIEITSDNFILGRKRDAVSYCFVGESYKGISRIHAAIKFDGTDYYIEDKNSSGGTFVNENRVPSGRLWQLESGDEIKLYTTRLLFEVSLDV